MNLHELAARNYKVFPGYKLVDYYEAAFPSYALILETLVEVERPLPAIDEFILKAIDADVRTVSAIADLLGLEWVVIESSIIGMLRSGFVSVVSSTNENHSDTLVTLTKKGQKTLSSLLLLLPETANMSVCVDAITDRTYRFRQLLQPRTVKNHGYHSIPTFVSPPDVTQVDRNALKHLYSEEQAGLGKRRERKQFIDVLAIEKQWRAYRVMRVLQFLRPEDGAIQVLVYDGSERSYEHEQALLKMESEKCRPLRAEFQDVLSDFESGEPIHILSGVSKQQIEAARRKNELLPLIQEYVEDRTEAIEDAEQRRGSELAVERQGAFQEIENYRKEIEQLQSEISQLHDAAGGVEVLQMHEHRPKLIQALQEAESMLIIVSPWLRWDAVNNEFTEALTDTLKRGANVLIGYGFGDKKWQDNKVVSRLKRLGSNKKGRLRMYRVGDVHSKVLICDDKFMVISSFNWLSFAGDPKRGNRVEDGTVITDQEAIKAKKQEWLDRFFEMEKSKTGF